LQPQSLIWFSFHPQTLKTDQNYTLLQFDLIFTAASMVFAVCIYLDMPHIRACASKAIGFNSSSRQVTQERSGLIGSSSPPPANQITALASVEAAAAPA
jgi:hypothetical protein